MTKSTRIAIFAAALTFATAAHGIGLRQVIRDCGPDSKLYCKNVGYGAPMQACLFKNKAKLRPVCRSVVDRIAQGERVRLFG
jgi:hypothetical protein